MLRSMYSGISGMKANQVKMDIVGNNVANVGTTAFKKSSARFSDALNQSMIYASGASATVGGVNPGQVGIGTKVIGINKYMTQGSLQPTGRPSDLALDGDGFFVIDLGDGEIGYTRDGSFNIDTDGQLVTAEGYRVLNSDGDPITIDLSTYISFTVGKDGAITGIEKDGNKVELGTINVATFPNPEGLEMIGGNIYKATVASGDVVNNSAVSGSVIQGAIEMSNVDLSEEFTDMIVTTRAFQASSKVITTSDELLQEIINLKR